MRYFTKDWYTEMQISGFLVFPDSKEEWEESINYYKSEGIDYLRNFKEDLESRKPDLLKFLPEFFHPYIHDGTLNSVYPSAELRKAAEQWRADYQKRMNKVSSQYVQYYRSIKEKLPKNVIQLHEKSFHDAMVKSFASPSTDTFVITLDCSGGFHYFTDVTLTFVGVEELLIPDRFQGAWWLYDEVYATEKGFELNVLMESPFSEMKIIAENIQIDHP